MKNWIKGTNATILSLAVIGLFILLTIFLHSMKGLQWDLTANKKFTLSDQTVTALKELDKPVHVVAFSSQDPYMDRQVTDLLQEYQKRSGNFTYEFIDPVKQPSIAQQYKIDQYGTIVFDNNGQTKNLYSYELFGYGSTEGSYAFSGEEKFTQALVSLTSNEKRKVYFLTGHGEMTSTQLPSFVSNLTGEGYEVSDLNLVQEAQIPEDAESIFVLSPQSDLTEAEQELLKGYAEGEGRLLVTLDLAQNMDQWANWNEILGIYGVTNEHALIIDSKQTLMNDPFTIVPTYNYHQIVNKLREENRITLFPGAIGLSFDSSNENWKASTILKSSDNAYGKTNLGLFASGQIRMEDLNKTDDDLSGPIDLAYAIENGDGKPKAVIIGNGVFLSDQLLNQQGNRDFILNSIGWLNERESSVTIRPREEAQLQQAFLSASQANTIFIGTVVVIPLLFLITGGLIWWRRRRG
ncbi:GldG family protein [Paenibacillus sp. J2TS4]|uniref:GldG family protein n=1 Tax=Paenibacillus sp. J2TS4 TaxID=2807194 RepID=UPI001B1F4092|nr:Gldg family protein [Paenibacillus sp. J2TS4]GIP35652.1 hypothetical protein J2TS4_48620 [Paenibacillus sp. J2TS4]